MFEFQSHRPNLESSEERARYQAEIQQARPFYWVLMSILLMVFFWTLYDDPAMRAPGPLALFTTLLALHGVLHWLSPQLYLRRGLLYPYFLVQLILLLSITFLTRQVAVAGLFFGTTGEAIGMIERIWPKTVIAGSYLVLAVLSFGLMAGWESIPLFVGWIIPMAFFVIVYVVLFNRQSRSRQEAQQLLRELETAHRQLAEYATQVEDLTRTTERQRMARELHDTLAQGLAGLILQLEAADSHVGSGSPGKAREIIQQAMSRARTTLAEARGAIDQLRDEEGTRLGLVEAIQNEAERFNRSTGIPCELDLEPIPAIPEPTSEHVKRIVAESLANILRHAQANNVQIHLGKSQGDLHMMIQDDGVGFDTQKVFSRTGHYGLVGVRERARLAGGKLSIESQPGEGTTLRLKIPLDERLEKKVHP